MTQHVVVFIKQIPILWSTSVKYEFPNAFSNIDSSHHKSIPSFGVKGDFFFHFSKIDKWNLILLQKQANYRIVIDEANNIVDKYCGIVTKFEIEKSKDSHGINVEGHANNKLSQVFVDAAFLMERRNSESPIKLIDIKNFDLCKALQTTKNAPNFVSIAKKILEESGKIPENCPIVKDYKFSYKYVHLDPMYFPLIPAAKFKFTITGYTTKSNMKYFCYNANVTGQVIYNKKKFTIGWNGWLVCFVLNTIGIALGTCTFSMMAIDFILNSIQTGKCSCSFFIVLVELTKNEAVALFKPLCEGQC